MGTPLTNYGPISYGFAKRLRGNNASLSHVVVMATVICEKCGARFVITHQVASQDAGLAAKQAVWLEDRFVWDHIQEYKHAGSIPLPGSPEVKSATAGRS
jgi:hypothetical protein